MDALSAPVASILAIPAVVIDMTLVDDSETAAPLNVDDVGDDSTIACPDIMTLAGDEAIVSAPTEV